MVRELADITVYFEGIEDVDFDELEDYLSEHKVKYKVIKAENQRTESDDPDFGKPDPYDEYMDRKMCGEL